ncbi:MAG: hypothetical protein HGA19_07660 [Oscillochloris sp.]|nr:hypothetical protein [Oscillochloris sp.]
MTQRIIDPVLNIYIGTSPSRLVAEHVNREMRHLPETDRRRVASLLIDTMRLQVQTGHLYGADVLQIQTPRYERHAAWTPSQKRNMYISNPTSEYKPGISIAGAGGIRNNGHVALCSLSTSTEQRIKEKLNQITAPPPEVQHEQATNGLRINIITFLGGGTGSGILPALSVISRLVANMKVAQPHVAIYAVLPEQPRGLTEEMKRRQRSNAIASLMELTAVLRLKDQQVTDTFVLGPLELDVSSLHVVDVIYLYGHGLLTNHEDIYQLIAMDLCLRIQDGHGAGFERKRQLPDLSALKNTDDRKLPTCFATSGVAEVIFPRTELIAAWARAAARSLITAQAGLLDTPDDTHHYADELARILIDLIAKEVETLGTLNRPSDFDSDAVDDGEAWAERLEHRCEEYRRQMSHALQPKVLSLTARASEQITGHVQKFRTAAYDRSATLYSTLAARMRTEYDKLTIPEPEERDLAFEDRVFHPTFFDRLRRLDGQFADYANQHQNNRFEAIRFRFFRDLVREISQRFDQEADLQRSLLNAARTNAMRLKDSDRTLLEEGKLPYAHPYNRMALPNRQLIEHCYLQMLQKLGLGDRQNGLSVGRVFEELDRERTQREEARQRGINAGTIRPDAPAENSGMYPNYEEFFGRRFTEYFNPGGHPRPIVELIREVGGNELLRTHLGWGLRWALQHLEYNMFQEPQTYGRIVRQLDVAVTMEQRNDLRQEIQQFIDQESSRSEIQNNLKLMEAADADRISFLYSEYGIPLRAINGLHENQQSSSYLADYIESQRQWATGRTAIPPHSSDLMQEWVARSIPGEEALVLRLADDPSRIKLDELYPTIYGSGSQP